MKSPYCGRMYAASRTSNGVGDRRNARSPPLSLNLNADPGSRRSLRSLRGHRPPARDDRPSPDPTRRPELAAFIMRVRPIVAAILVPALVP